MNPPRPRLQQGVVIGAIAALLQPAGSEAQLPGPRSLQVSNAVVPETVTVGQSFRAYLRVALPDGASAEFALPEPGDTVEAVGEMRVQRHGERARLAEYPLVAWAAGIPPTVDVGVRIRFAGGETRAYEVPLRVPVVMSVLPDTGVPDPRPAKGFIGLSPGRAVGWGWSLLLLLLSAVAAAFWWARRRRLAEPDSPRTLALLRLNRLGARPEGEDQVAEFYSAASRILRGYAAALGPAFGEDLTSRELLSRLAESGAHLQAEELKNLLEEADRVKFAGEPKGVADAARFWVAVRGWVEQNPLEPPRPARKAA